MSYELKKTKLYERLKLEVLSPSTSSTPPYIRRGYFQTEQPVFVVLKSINTFYKLPCIMHKLEFFFLLFLSRFISFKSIGTKEVTILHSVLAFLTISQRKKH